METCCGTDAQLCDESELGEGSGLQRLMVLVSSGVEERSNWVDQKRRRCDLFDKLESMGINDGDIVSLYDREFEYQR